MSRSTVAAPFTARKAGAVLGLARTVVTRLIAAGFVAPVRGPAGDQRFTFLDLRLLRTAHALEQAGVSPRKIMRSLARLKADLPVDASLAGLRIIAVGADVAVRDPSGKWHAETGQRLLDFDAAAEVVAGTATVVDLPQGASAAAEVDRADQADRAESWFAKGVALEGVDDAAAEDAYRHAVALDPGHFNARLNLGARLCESGRHPDALNLYDAMLESFPALPLLHFNRAVALENLGRPREALTAYDHTLEIDPTFADAHFNAGHLRQELGDPRGALRHFSACRRLRSDPAR